MSLKDVLEELGCWLGKLLRLDKSEILDGRTLALVRLSRRRESGKEELSRRLDGKGEVEVPGA